MSTKMATRLANKLQLLQKVNQTRGRILLPSVNFQKRIEFPLEIYQKKELK